MRTVRLGALLAALLLIGAARAGEVRLVRDTWGVPHIFAGNLVDGAYAMGYAQAEDRIDQIMTTYRLASGRMAEIAGPSMVEWDWRAIITGQERVCKAKYGQVPAELRAMIEAFQAGVRAWMAKNPTKIPPTVIEMEPWMVLAVGRMIIFNWPVDRGFEELEAGRRSGFASNQWAVRPERTADGAALLLIDPHIPWDGPFRFWEFRLHVGDDLVISGFGPAGAPTVGLGHNNYTGFACTTGGPDTTDVYIETVNPANAKQYQYDGQWRTMTSATYTIKVRGAEPVIRELDSTHHGPIIGRDGDKAFSLACPYLEEVGLIEQLYRMQTARNLSEFNAALGMNQLMEQNVMYADIAGNIQYVRTGRVPIRPAGNINWERPVPGHTSATEWLGIHPMRDLIQVRNPATGYLQNCNISPDTMARNLGLKLSDWPAYIHDDEPGRSNSRGRRAVELLERHDKLTIDQAVGIALDCHADGAELWIAEARALLELVDDGVDGGMITRDQGDTLLAALRPLAAWDGMMDQTSTAATLYRFWRQQAAADGAQLTGESITDEMHLAVGLALLKTCETMKQKYGRIDVPYGELHRVARGGFSYPCSGGDSGGGMTLRAISWQADGDKFIGRAGNNWVQLIQFRPGAVRSWSLTPYGQSDDPASPHFMDQAEKLFSPTLMKPTWLAPGELAAHTESTISLIGPGVAGGVAGPRGGLRRR